MMPDRAADRCSRRQWRRADRHRSSADAAGRGGLFGLNAAITGEFNYQGGDRKTFYGGTRLSRSRTTRRPSTTSVRAQRPKPSLPARRARPPRHSLPVFRAQPRSTSCSGGHTGLLPYFFPGLVALLLFLRGARSAGRGSGCAAATIAGGDGDAARPTCRSPTRAAAARSATAISSASIRCSCFLMPPLGERPRRPWSPRRRRALHRQILLNPFYSSFNPGEHAKTGRAALAAARADAAQRSADDVPTADRSKQPLGGTPPMLGVFPTTTPTTARATRSG